MHKVYVYLNVIYMFSVGRTKKSITHNGSGANPEYYWRIYHTQLTLICLSAGSVIFQARREYWRMPRDVDDLIGGRACVRAGGGLNDAVCGMVSGSGFPNCSARLITFSCIHLFAFSMVSYLPSNIGHI